MLYNSTIKTTDIKLIRILMLLFFLVILSLCVSLYFVHQKYEVLVGLHPQNTPLVERATVVLLTYSWFYVSL